MTRVGLKLLRLLAFVVMLHAYPFGDRQNQWPPRVAAEFLQRKLPPSCGADLRSQLFQSSVGEHSSHLPPALSVATDCSSAERRASMSSISMALAAWLKMESATRAFTDAGVFG